MEQHGISVGTKCMHDGGEYYKTPGVSFLILLKTVVAHVSFVMNEASFQELGNNYKSSR